jgi:hypothetical protein
MPVRTIAGIEVEYPDDAALIGAANGFLRKLSIGAATRLEEERTQPLILDLTPVEEEVDIVTGA